MEWEAVEGYLSVMKHVGSLMPKPVIDFGGPMVEVLCWGSAPTGPGGTHTVVSQVPHLSERVHW